MRHLCATLFVLLVCVATVHAEERLFTLFGVDLPEGWDGGEKQDFKVGDGDGYMLVLSCPTPDGEGVAAAVSLFVLPNIHHDDSATHAAKLATLQENASAPYQDGPFWAFTGEPRSRSVQGPAVTRVNVTPEQVLVAIVQDTGDNGAEAVFHSLQGRTEAARRLLGQ